MSTTNTPPKRPDRNHPAVLQAAAARLAPAVYKWCNDTSITLEEVQADLAKALHYNDDGYEIARSLEREGYSPDESLVEILSGAFSAKRSAESKACEAWVQETQQQAPAIGAQVTWPKKPEAGIGTVTTNHPDGRSTVAFAALGHVPAGQPGSQGYIIEWESLQPAHV